MIKFSDPRLSVIVPVHNGEGVLPDSLQALRTSDLPASRWELIVVDDASTDETARIAEQYADRVTRLEGAPRGPAYARNRGAEVARGDILVFVDADVCVHADVLRRFLDTFADDPGASAVFGAYDQSPRAPGLVSQYRNLLHHYVHASHVGEAETFWAGCGAVRRAPFLRAGLFDSDRYPRPQIEDIELGYRLRALGYRILLRPDIQATHLKEWTLSSMLVSDARDRGGPWMRLLLEQGSAARGTLNVRPRERWLTGAAALAFLALAAAAFTGSRALLGISGALVLVILAYDLPFLRWFSRVRGPWAAMRVVPLRYLYYLLNAAVAATVVAWHTGGRIMGNRPGAPAPRDQGQGEGGPFSERPLATPSQGGKP